MGSFPETRKKIMTLIKKPLRKERTDLEKNAPKKVYRQSLLTSSLLILNHTPAGPTFFWYWTCLHTYPDPEIKIKPLQFSQSKSKKTEESLAQALSKKETLGRRQRTNSILLSVLLLFFLFSSTYVTPFLTPRFRLGLG